MLELLRRSPTFGSRGLPLDPARPQEWGATAHQYEAVQPPLYYALMVPAYVAGKPWGVVGSLYAVRVASVLLAVAAVPLTWLLAALLFPRRPEIWNFSALLLAVVQGFNANTASATNDALVLPLAVGALLVIVRNAGNPGRRGAIVSGVLIGAAMLAKLNAVALIPMLGTALLIPPGFRDRSLWWRIRWGAAAASTSALALVPWFAWNRHAYGTFAGGADEAVRLLQGVQVTYPFGLEGLREHLENSMSGFWQFQRFSPHGPGNYGWLFVGAAMAALAGLLLLPPLSRGGSRRRLVWLAGCWPVTFLAMLAIVYLAYTGSIVGRHTYPALVPLTIFTAGGVAVVLGRRFATIALVALLAASLWVEQAEYKRYLDSIYIGAMPVADSAPAWEQPFNFGWAPALGVRVNSPCPIVAVGLGIRDQPPALIEAATNGRTTPASLVHRHDRMYRYRLKEPFAGAVDIRFPAPVLLGMGDEPSGRVTFSGGDGNRSAMAEIHCPTSDAERAIFRRNYPPLHPGWISYGAVMGWARAWAWAGVLLALVLSAAQLRRPPGTGR